MDYTAGILALKELIRSNYPLRRLAVEAAWAAKAFPPPFT
jgi:hypothetical protein